jgi:hypothetical protein
MPVHPCRGETQKDTDMENIVLVTARRLAWDLNEASRQPALVAFVTRELKKMKAEEGHTKERQAEIDYLIKRLKGAHNRPALA